MYAANTLSMTAQPQGVEISSKKERGLKCAASGAVALRTLLCAPAGAETFAVNAGENALVTDEGAALTAWGEYATAAFRRRTVRRSGRCSPRRCWYRAARRAWRREIWRVTAC